MLTRHDHNKMGRGDEDWLHSLFHFSFDDYFNEKNIRFGVLRVLNDDLVAPGRGFELHPHRDMEIISYVVDGELTHADSMGNERTLKRGSVQYMSAGRGVRHSEHNCGTETLRLLQIWIIPDEKDLEPNYGDHEYAGKDRVNQWLQIVSGISGQVPVRIHQDANVYVAELDAGRSLSFRIPEDRQAYVVQIEGRSTINDAALDTRDALSVVGEDIEIQADERSHLMLIEMARLDEYEYA